MAGPRKTSSGFSTMSPYVDSLMDINSNLQEQIDNRSKDPKKNTVHIPIEVELLGNDTNFLDGIFKFTDSKILGENSNFMSEALISMKEKLTSDLKTMKTLIGNTDDVQI